MDKHNVINVIATMKESVLLAKWYEGGIVYNMVANDIFGIGTSIQLKLPDNIQATDVVAFFKEHGIDGYIALLKYVDTEGYEILPAYDTPGYRELKPVVVDWVKSLMPIQDVGGVTDTDVKTINQLVWLRTHTRWVDFCICDEPPNQPWWVTSIIAGTHVNILLTKEMLFRRKIGKKVHPSNHLDVYNINGLDGLCELAAEHIGKPLPIFN